MARTRSCVACARGGRRGRVVLTARRHGNDDEGNGTRNQKTRAGRPSVKNGGVPVSRDDRTFVNGGPVPGRGRRDTCAGPDGTGVRQKTTATASVTVRKSARLERAAKDVRWQALRHRHYQRARRRRRRRHGALLARRDGTNDRPPVRLPWTASRCETLGRERVQSVGRLTVLCGGTRAPDSYGRPRNGGTSVRRWPDGNVVPTAVSCLPCPTDRPPARDPRRWTLGYGGDDVTVSRPRRSPCRRTAVVLRRQLLLRFL